MKRLVAIAGLAACGATPVLPDAAPSGPHYPRAIPVTAPMPIDGDQFGYRIALGGDGRVLAVGVPRDDASPTGITGDRSDPDAGAVYVFTWGGTQWESQAYLKPRVLDPADQFGASVGLSALGDTLVVGAPGEDGGPGHDVEDNSVAGSGAAYVFKRHGTTWMLQDYLKAAKPGVDDGFGTAVAISADGNTVAVGALGEDSRATGVDGDPLDNTLTDSGAAYVFTTDGMAWTQAAYLKAAHPDKADRFGEDLALSGDGAVLAIGASGEDSAALGVGGDQADNTATNAGAAYVFRRTAGAWAQEAYLKASNSGTSDGFGLHVALSGLGTTLVVAAPFEDSANAHQTDDSIMDSGAAYVFGFDGAAWTQRAYLKSPTPTVSDQLGQAVAISADGHVVAVSAPNDDGVAMNGGAVYTFSDAAGPWQRAASVTAQTPAVGAQLGSSLGLSSDGSVLAIGIALDSATALEAGSVQVAY